MGERQIDRLDEEEVEGLESSSLSRKGWCSMKEDRVLIGVGRAILMRFGKVGGGVIILVLVDVVV